MMDATATRDDMIMALRANLGRDLYQKEPTNEQLRLLYMLIGEAHDGSIKRDVRLYVLRKLTGKENLESGKNLGRKEASVIIDTISDWFGISQEWKEIISDIIDEGIAIYGACKKRTRSNEDNWFEE